MGTSTASEYVAVLEALDRAAGWDARGAVEAALTGALPPSCILSSEIPITIPMLAVRRECAARGIAVSDTLEYGWDMGGFFVVNDGGLIQQVINKMSGRE